MEKKKLHSNWFILLAVLPGTRASFNVLEHCTQTDCEWEKVSEEADEPDPGSWLPWASQGGPSSCIQFLQTCV